MFQPVYDSRYQPVRAEPSYRPPVSPAGGVWTGVRDGTEWVYEGAGETALVWNDLRPITDYYPYNQGRPDRDRSTGQPPTNPFVRPEELGASALPPFPVSDLAVSVSVEPTEAPVAVTPTIAARGFVFQGVADPVSGRATVRMRPEAGGSDDGAGAWTELDSGRFGGLRPGRVTHIEFWHVDQALWLFVDGELIAGGPERGAYTLSPAQRAGAAMVPDFDELVATDERARQGSYDPGVTAAGVFARNDQYRAPRVRWSFAGGPMKVHRVQVERDIFYQPAPFRFQKPTRGAHYNNFPTLNADQFFMLGDNSPNSEDSRYWTSEGLDPWVRERIDDTPGVVNRDLIVGKAFIVYFPAPLDGGPILAPDFGRLRWIW
jgi:signal peptidase I